MRIIKKKTARILGSIVLEASVALPVIIIVIASMLSSMTVVNAEMCMHRATENVIQEVNVAIPFAASGFNCLDEVSAALGIGDLFDVNTGCIDDILGYFGYVSGATGVELEDVLTTALFGRYIRDRIVNEYALLTKDAHICNELLDEVSVYLDCCKEENTVLVNVFYKLRFGNLTSERKLVSSITIYAENIKVGASDGEKEPDSDVWEKDNFDRGIAFREMFGGNLPYNYPVISKFENGRATMIKSMDTTSPYYQDLSTLERVLKGYIDDLSSFQGRKWGDTEILPGQISSKEIIIVIPQNGAPECKAAIESLRSYAAERGITLKIEEYGISKKYGGEKEADPYNI